MQRLNTMRHTPLQPQRGVTLIESLVALVVIALGILGILGVQMRTLTDTQTGVRRAQAIRLIEDMGERMKVNPNALANINAYVTAFADTPTLPNCASGCNAAQLAAYDVAVWKRIVRENLPTGQASIFVPPAESGLATGLGRQLGVMIAWRENEERAPRPTILTRLRCALPMEPSVQGPHSPAQPTTSATCNISPWHRAARLTLRVASRCITAQGLNNVKNHSCHHSSHRD